MNLISQADHGPIDRSHHNLRFGAPSHNRVAPTTLQATTTFIVGIDLNADSSPAMKGRASAAETLKLKKLCDQLKGGHEAILLHSFSAKQILQEPHGLSTLPFDSKTFIARFG